MNLEERIGNMNNPLYPLSAKYDARWIIANQMGSHCLWLTEALVKSMTLTTGMRVLDLGCGKALSAVFLAKEFRVQVWALYLQVDPNENWRRIQEAGVQDLVFPVRGNAMDLPFTDGAGVRIWRDFLWILDPEECKWLDADDGRNISFLRLLATKKAE